jgi:hypothetical protein
MNKTLKAALSPFYCLGMAVFILWPYNVFLIICFSIIFALKYFTPMNDQFAIFIGFTVSLAAIGIIVNKVYPQQ